jgi:hypothetical protein
LDTSTPDETTRTWRPSRCRIRLAAVIVLWTVAIEVSLWAVVGNSWGRIVYYLDGTHGIHKSDVLLIGGSVAAATVLSVVLLWPCVSRRLRAGG